MIELEAMSIMTHSEEFKTNRFRDENNVKRSCQFRKRIGLSANFGKVLVNGRTNGNFLKSPMASFTSIHCTTATNEKPTVFSGIVTGQNKGMWK
jgi:inosine/xanthosine triphosphate pyrophosphatase family protein